MAVKKIIWSYTVYLCLGLLFLLGMCVCVCVCVRARVCVGMYVLAHGVCVCVRADVHGVFVSARARVCELCSNRWTSN